MRGVILAAGSGSRLGYPAAQGGKAMVKLLGRPLIWWAANKLIAADILDILIVVSPANQAAIQTYINNSGLLAQFSFVQQVKPLGIAQALSLAQNFTKEDNLALLLVDNVFSADLKAAVKAFQGGAGIFLHQVANPKELGVAVIEQDRVVKLIEKPEQPISNWAVTGIYLYDAQVFELTKDLKPSPRGEYEITDLNRAYLRQGKLQYQVLEGFWLDIARPESLTLAAQSLGG